jgi:hypothetical protein
MFRRNGRNWCFLTVDVAAIRCSVETGAWVVEVCSRFVIRECRIDRFVQGRRVWIRIWDTSKSTGQTRGKIGPEAADAAAEIRISAALVLRQAFRKESKTIYRVAAAVWRGNSEVTSDILQIIAMP